MKFSTQFIRESNRMCDRAKFEPAPYFRKSFTLDFVPTEAEITICGLGFYELSINGTPITKGPLAPYISNPDDILYYDRYDLLPYLKQGKNVIGILLGNGFRNCYGGYIWKFDQAACRGPVCVALSAEIKNGERELCFEADESFRTHPSPVLYNDLRMGYGYDSTQAIDGWDAIDFDDNDWGFAEREETPHGTPRLCLADPIAVVGELAPIEIVHHDTLCFYHKKYDPKTPEEYTRRNDVYVYDFGKNVAGVTRLKINGRPGQKITVRHGEHLVDGEFVMNNILCYSKDEELNRFAYDHNQTDVFICRGGWEEFLPRFKYDGFRYAMVEGLEPEQATPELLIAVMMNSAVSSRADFTCSDPVLNQLQTIVQNSDLANLYYFPTDCPQREKNGWTGDAAVSAEQMLLNFDAERSLREWLFNVRAAQNEQGAFPGIVPTGGWGFHWGNGPAWDNVCVELPLRIYQHTGDVGVIEENADAIVRYLDYIFTRRDERGLIHVGLGDWVDPYLEQNGGITAPLEVTDTLTVYNMMRNAAFLLDEIGRNEDADKIRDMADTLHADFRCELIDDNMMVAGNCRTSQAFSLASNIFTAKEYPIAAKRLLEMIDEKELVNTCGMIGLRHIFHVLTELGRSDLALRIIKSEHRTCYGYWIKMGATSAWECMEEANHYKRHSLNHHFLCDISNWFIGELAGLCFNPNANDITYFEVCPHPVLEGDTSFARAHYDAPAGRIEVEWNRHGNELVLSITIPSGLHTTVQARDGWLFADQSTEIYIPYSSDTQILRFSLKKSEKN